MSSEKKVESTKGRDNKGAITPRTAWTWVTGYRLLEKTSARRKSLKSVGCKREGNTTKTYALEERP